MYLDFKLLIRWMCAEVINVTIHGNTAASISKLGCSIINPPTFTPLKDIFYTSDSLNMELF